MIYFRLSLELKNDFERNCLRNRIDKLRSDWKEFEENLFDEKENEISSEEIRSNGEIFLDQTRKNIEEIEKISNVEDLEKSIRKNKFFLWNFSRFFQSVQKIESRSETTEVFRESLSKLEEILRSKEEEFYRIKEREKQEISLRRWIEDFQERTKKIAENIFLTNEEKLDRIRRSAAEIEQRKNKFLQFDKFSTKFNEIQRSIDQTEQVFRDQTKSEQFQTKFFFSRCFVTKSSSRKNSDGRLTNSSRFSELKSINSNRFELSRKPSTRFEMINDVSSKNSIRFEVKSTRSIDSSRIFKSKIHPFNFTLTLLQTFVFAA